MSDGMTLNGVASSYCDECEYSNKKSLKNTKLRTMKAIIIKDNRKHQAELEVGSLKQYPLYKLLCNPCELSFKTHNDLLNHTCKVHLPNCQQHLRKLNRESKEGNSNFG